MNTPIIFIHYGDSPYLKYTLRLAVKTNPDKEVVLLGDSKNEKYKSIPGIRHIHFSRYDNTDSVEELNRNFTYVAGANRQTPQDRRFELFCFKRWLYLSEFMKETGITTCWYFDSDTLILSRLREEEGKFGNYEVTEQSNGSNMKGLIRTKALENFTGVIRTIFLDTEYIARQKEEFKTHPNYALCDMRVYQVFKEKYRPKTIELRTDIQGEFHDENICQLDSGIETEYIDSLKRTVKKLYFLDGKIYEKNKTNKKMLRVMTLNMSWVTTSFIEKVYYYVLYGKSPPPFITVLNKAKRLPRFIKVALTRETK